VILSTLLPLAPAVNKLTIVPVPSRLVFAADIVALSVLGIAVYAGDAAIFCLY
jgi:hypothetical protein